MYLGLFGGIVLTVMLGNLILSAYDRTRALLPLENLAFSFLLGQGAVTLLVFFLFFLPVPERPFVLGAGIAAAFLGKLFLIDKFKIKGFSRMPFFHIKRVLDPRTLAITLLILLMLIKVSYVLVETCSKPEYSWDACGNWTLLGRYAYYVDRDHPDQVLDMLIHCGSNYPKQISFMHYWLFRWMGEANDQWSKIFFPLDFICFLYLFFVALRKRRGTLGALLFTYILASTPLFIYHATIGYADLSSALYFSAGIICFYRWISEKKEAFFWLFCTFLSLTIWLKLEGKPLVILGFLILLIYAWFEYRGSVRQVVRRLGQYLMLLLVIGLPWQLFSIVNRLSSREEFAFHLKYVLEFHALMYTKLFLQGSWSVFWVGAIAALAFFFRDLIQKENRYLLLTILLFYGIILFIYLFTGDAYGWFEVSFNRVMLNIYPVVAFTVAVIIPRIRLKGLGEI